MRGLPERAPQSMRDERTHRIKGPEGLITRHGRQYLIIVPRMFGIVGTLDLHQIKVVDHEAILAQPAIPGKEIFDRHLAHLGGNLEWLVGTKRLDRLEV